MNAINGFSRCLVAIDTFCEAIPVLSSVTNGINIALKIIFATLQVNKICGKNPYVTHILNKNIFTTFLLLIPFVGQVIVLLLAMCSGKQALEGEDTRARGYSQNSGRAEENHGVNQENNSSITMCDEVTFTGSKERFHALLGRAKGKKGKPLTQLSVNNQEQIAKRVPADVDINSVEQILEQSESCFGISTDSMHAKALFELKVAFARGRVNESEIQAQTMTISASQDEIDALVEVLQEGFTESEVSKYLASIDLLQVV